MKKDLGIYSYCDVLRNPEIAEPSGGFGREMRAQEKIVFKKKVFNDFWEIFLSTLSGKEFLAKINQQRN